MKDETNCNITPTRSFYKYLRNLIIYAEYEDTAIRTVSIFLQKKLWTKRLEHLRKLDDH